MLDRFLNNLKTTIAGTATAIVALIALFGVEIDPVLVSSILLVIVAVLGIFAKD